MMPPPWLKEFVHEVAGTLQPIDPLAPIGCHFFHDPDTKQWEVSLFVSLTEIFGGEADGTKSLSRYVLDLKPLLAFFHEVTAFGWQPFSLGEGDDLGPHVSLEGTVAEENIWLRILAEPPAGLSSGRVLNAYTMKLEDIW